MNDAGQAAEAFLEAAQLNRDDPLLNGSLLEFPDYGQVVMTGDLHGHRRNFDKLQRYCDLEHFGARHVILHELIHEEVASMTACDNSHEVLLDAARWKCAFPDQIHFLQSNHELAQATGHEISKNGRIVTMAFEEAVFGAYDPGPERVIEAMYVFIQSLPLAGRTPHRIFLSHSLPSPRDLPGFDPAIFSRFPTLRDYKDRGSAHMLIWGRYHTKPALETLAELLNVDYFICGHQPQEMGFSVLHERMLILASDHNHGVFLPLDLSKPVTLEKLTKNIRPFAGIM
ncbi:MAG: metallophosphoesterase [Planctomycetota bacterium]|jgi:hypothetical protein